ncbi:MAG: peptide chain release factor N(5)-glutamine methyltransferase [Clostridia bacterium]|nr:peptide chain release factor N(5)-glutamine methyltransferase [Clostridia bacterium]
MKLAQLISQTGEPEATIQTLCHLLKMERTQVFLLKDIKDDIALQAMNVVKEYKKGIPLAYLLGHTFFYNHDFIVTKDVLVPRYDTEHLVLWAQRTIIADFVVNAGKETYKILDLCCGSGIIGVCLAAGCAWLNERHKNFQYEVTASDFSEAALDVTSQNAALHNADIKLVHSDLLEDIHEKFDMIVSNPPYIRTMDIGVEDKRILQEPRMALDGGPDGLYFYRRILATAKKNLKPNGTILFEIGYDQAKDVTEIAAKLGYKNITVYKDLANHDRVVTMRV